jgi:hypothetical protein
MRIYKTAHTTYREKPGVIWVDAHPPTPTARYRMIQWPGNYEPPWPAYITWIDEEVAAPSEEYPVPDWADQEDSVE